MLCDVDKKVCLSVHVCVYLHLCTRPGVRSSDRILATLGLRVSGTVHTK